MRRRKAHGTAAECGARIVFETPPVDELRPVTDVSAERIEHRGNGQFTAEGAKAAARRRWELAKLPDWADYELKLVPRNDWLPFEEVRKANYDKATREIFEVTGGCSRRVRTVLRGWAFLQACAEYHAALFVTTGDDKADDRAERRIKAASIELAKAWEFAQLDAASRPQDPRQKHDFVAALETSHD